MQRIDDIVLRLRELRETLTDQRSVDTVEMAIYELENGFNPADGVWIVKESGRNLSKFAELSELERVDIKRLAALEFLRVEMAAAMREAIEKTRETTPGGATWWTYSTHDVIDKMFRIMAVKEIDG